jgi:tyrosinase
MQRWESEPLALPTHDVPFVEASLDFEDIQHDGPSFTVYVYFDNPEVDAAAGADGEGYVGKFRVFGHGDCWGGQGHCDPSHHPIHDFDLRPAHPLAPIDLSLDCTEALREIAEKDEVRVTALAYSDDPEAEDILRFAGLSLVTYD